MNPSTELRAGVAAFFDIDGTLLPPPSLERQFRRFLRWRGELRARHRLRWFGHFLTAVWRDALAATHGNKFHYADVRLATMQAWLAFLRRHPLPFFPQALDCMAWHAAHGHPIILVSGTIQPLAHLVAESLRARLGALTDAPIHLEVLATELEARNDRFTGHLAGPAVCGAQKARAIEALVAQKAGDREELAAARHLNVSRSPAPWAINLAASFAYGDSYLDRWMLSRVGHPAAVNPSFLLEWLARRRGWPILHWRHSLPTHTKSPTPERGFSAASVLQTDPANRFQESNR